MKEHVKEYKSYIAITILLAIVITLYFFTSKIIALLLTFFIFVPSLVWFILAPNNICFTFVREGTAKIILKGGSFHRVVFEWQNHFMDNKGYIWKNEEQEIFEETFWERKIIKPRVKLVGGLYWIGMWPFFTVYKETRRWSELVRTDSGDGMDQVSWSEKKERDYIFLPPAVYYTKVVKVETSGGERIPVTVELLITMMVINPQSFAFSAPPNTWDAILARIDALSRGKLGALTLDQILALRGNEGIWQILKDESFFKGDTAFYEEDEEGEPGTLWKWGVLVSPQGIEVRDIDLPPDYEEAAAKEKKAAMEAKARSQRIIGTIISAFANIKGIDPKDVPSAIENDPKMQKEFLKISKELLLPELAMEVGAYTKIDVDGAQGIEKTLLNIIAALKKIPSSKKENKNDDDDKLIY